MTGSETVRAFRQQLAKRQSPGAAPRQAASKPAFWRKPVVLAAVAVSLVGFGSIMVQAGDNAGVYEVARQYTRASGGPRFQLPQIFAPAPRPAVRTSLSYAPLYPGVAALPSTGKRTLDRQRRDSRLNDREGQTKQAKSSKSTPLDHKDFQAAYLRSRTSYCVRSCDGFFFPIGNADTGSSAAHEAACVRACPGAETSVFVADAGSKGIDDAFNRRGQRYQATQTAFNYRTQLDAACSCNPAGVPRNYSVLTDFTLRPGDMVMSREGLKVFRGTEKFPYRSAHFGNAGSVKMSARDRRFVQQADAASLREMGGSRARRNAPLEVRIAAQVGQVRGLSTVIDLRGVQSHVAMSDGPQMRYVGPHDRRAEQR